VDRDAPLGHFARQAAHFVDQADFRLHASGAEHRQQRHKTPLDTSGGKPRNDAKNFH
jgi:hypothetical protein